MRYSNYPFTLDVHKTLSQVSIPVTLGDTARQLFIGLTDGGKPYIIPDGCRATLSARKADGNCLLHDCIIEKNTTIRYDFTDQTATATGKMDCQILLYGTNGRLITSPRFTMVVYADIVGYDVLSETDLQSIGRMLAAEQERVAAENARVEAENGRVEADIARDEKLDEALGDLGNRVTIDYTKNFAYDFTQATPFNWSLAVHTVPAFCGEIVVNTEAGFEGYRVNKVGVKASAAGNVRFIVCEVGENTLKQIAVIGEAAVDSETMTAVLTFDMDTAPFVQNAHTAILACADGAIIEAVPSVYNGIYFPGQFTFADANYYATEGDVEIEYQKTTDTIVGVVGATLLDIDHVDHFALREFIENTRTRLDDIEEDIPDVSALDNGKYVGVQNGKYALLQFPEVMDGQDGKDGADGLTPYIGENGNWFIGDVDTGVRAAGVDGKDGTNGVDGQDGITPHIGDNGNWFIGDVDTGVAAGGNGSDIIVDSELSLESENPVQNKAVTQEFKAFNEAAGAFNERLTSLEQSGVGGGSEYEIPTFDLVELGLPTIVFGGETVLLETDTTEIMAALDNGAVKFGVSLSLGEVMQVEAVMNGIGVPGQYCCSYAVDFGGVQIMLILVVMDGAIGGNIVEIASGGSGGVSSWNDLTDKPFDDNVTTIFDGVLQDTQSGDTWMGEPSAEDTSDAALVVGQTYTYTWDGKEYTSVCFSLEGINCIGNNAPVSGVDNGHPVLIFRHPTKWEAIVANNRNDTDGTYSLKITTAIKQLDNKYLEPFERQVGDVTEFLPSCKGATTYSSDYGVYGLSTPSTVEMFARWHGIDESIAPIEGNIFVEFDGVTYECAQQRLAALDYAMAIGNCTPFGGTGNNEPFVVTIMQNGNFYTWLIACLSDTSPTEHTARVYYRAPDKWLLKEQYLPDGIGSAVAQPVSIDLSGLDTSGTIVETYADGTTKTTTLEFDANGNPIKITDGDGNVTTLTW